MRGACPTHGSFNGATSSSTWKAALVAATASCLTVASMGPRRRRRGRYDEHICRMAAFAGFNGATSSSTWKELAIAVATDTPFVGASMGPRRRRRGRFATLLDAVLRVMELQWGHVVVDVEGFLSVSDELRRE